MAQYHDRVGFLIFENDPITGLSKQTVVEKPYYGKFQEHGRKWNPTDHRNDDLQLNNVIKITANDYARKHHSSIAYARYMGCYWKVDSIKIQAPEIILYLGGVWNGPTATSGQTP